MRESESRWRIRNEHEVPQETRRAAQPPLVRRERHALVRPPLAHRADGLSPLGLRRQARHRDHQYLERDQFLPQPLPPARRGSQARHLAGGRLSDRDAGAVARGTVPEADDDALSEPAGDGDRGAVALVSGRRLRADGRLRQDHAGPDPGRAVDEPAVDLRAGGSDAARRLQGQIPRQRLRHLEVLGGTARREHHR